ncbi:SUMF1/EgtB/PvdO family nonheme iron enzyme [Anaerolineales bacterium HSG25]|nr:SUMF1/EgtB/PvdO family nonheme iron enzyme [Anaerolineales bacterium HSG25]
MLSKTIYLSITVVLLISLYSQTHQSYAQDSYEPNDDCESATPIETDGTLQTHTFTSVADEDWLTFSVISGTRYLIDVQPPLESLADLIVTVYDGCNTVPIDTKNETFLPGARLNILAPADETYYLKITSAINELDPQADYSFRVTVRDIPQTPQPGALVLVAGRLRIDDSLQQNIYNVTDEVYKLFLANGYTGEEIYYMAHKDNNPDDDPSTKEVDNLDPNPTDLEIAITQWAVDKVGPNRAFTLYLMDHGTENKFYLDGPGQTVTAEELDSWLTELEQAVPEVRINIILEACHSGSFVKTLSKPGRLIMTSTASASVAYASMQGKRGAIFSDAFLNGLGQGMSLLNSFEEARAIAHTAHKDQQPWLDDNGDGLYTPADGQEAAKRGFAYTGTFPGVWNYPPHIVWHNIPKKVLAINDPLKIQVQVEDNDPTDNTTVWVRVYPPDYVPPVATQTETLVDETALIEREILWDDNADRIYETSYSFPEFGTYHLVIYARDQEGALGRPRRLTVVVPKQTYLPTVLRVPPPPPNMVYVPAGEFVMGSDNGDSDEQPVHTVYLDRFYIDTYEVTNVQYTTFLNQIRAGVTVEDGEFVVYQGNKIYDLICTNCSDWKDRIIWQNEQFERVSGYEAHPVSFVTWYGAQAYCQAQGKRLPTEAEWEKAARGTTGQIYPWGDETPTCDRLSYSGCVGSTTPVGSYPNGVSPYGVYDMAGNVSEWVQDYYDSDYYGKSPSSNPVNTLPSNYRVIRGNSWYHDHNTARSANRSMASQNDSGDLLGFRCARSSQP